MKPIVKLKDQARLHEQREEWEQAIQLYLQVLRAGDEREGETELALYNRVGDLYLRLGRVEEAVRYYEQAADRYADSGFYNNAIALCSKALRSMPGRSELYLRLGRLCATQGFKVDARRWFLEYAEQMLRAGDAEKAFEALRELADSVSDPEVRELVARQLAAHRGREEALAEYRRAYAERVRAGQHAEAEALRAEVRELDPALDLAAEGVTAAEADGVTAAEPPAAAPEWAAAEAPVAEGLVFEPLVPGEPPPSEPTAEPDVVEGLTLISAAGAAGIDDDLADANETEAAPLPLLDLGEDEPLGAAPFAPGAPAPAVEVPDLAADVLGSGAPEPAVEVPDLAADVPGSGAPAPATAAPEPVAVGPAAHADEPASTPEARAQAAADAALQRARELVALGRTAEAVQELDAEQRRLADAGHLEAALRVVDEVVRLDPDHVRAQQDRVEYSFRLELNDRLVGDYLDLAASLERAGSTDRAASIYRRVLDLDPANPVARAALARGSTGGRAPSVPVDDYVDLGELLRAEGLEPEETTRFVVPEEEPTGDEEQDFAEMLAQFKAKLAEHVPADDVASHYDLGLAFKEMGLIDEAIAQFQTALRAGRAPLKVYEELGHCFVLKEQYNVAIKVLSKALSLPYEDETELLGVYYHLGRCYEELGRPEEARDAYERVLGVDINFRDVAARLARL